jgi:hypothetical protein
VRGRVFGNEGGEQHFAEKHQRYNDHDAGTDFRVLDRR